MSLSRLLIAALAVGLIASPVVADPPGRGRGRDQVLVDPPGRGRGRDQDRVFEAFREGRSMPLPSIERRVLPFMGGADYLGPEFNGQTYRLKFMRDGRVIWVDVDAATGRIIGRSGR
jgi:hypothetical protein